MNYRDAIKEWKKIAENFFDARESIYKKALNLTIDGLKEGGKILVFGNGGECRPGAAFCC